MPHQPAPLRPFLVFAAVAGLALGARAGDDAPPPPDVPTPEQIEQVTQTKPVDSEGDVYVGETLTVDAARRRELAYRTIAVALDRPRSDKAEAADDLVCRRLQRVGSHITKVYCATNRTWNYIRKVSSREVFGLLAPPLPGYELREGAVYEINTGAIHALGKQFAAGDDAARLAQLAAEDIAAKTDDEWNTPAETVARFARALDAVTRAARSGDTAAQEAAMAAAIAAHGFTIEQYNELATRLESSGLFQRRVAAATQAINR